MGVYLESVINVNIERNVTFDLNGLSMEELSILRDSLKESIEKLDELYQDVYNFEAQQKRDRYSKVYNVITGAIDAEWEMSR